MQLLVKYSRRVGDHNVDGPDPYNGTAELMDAGTGATSQFGVSY